MKLVRARFLLALALATLTAGRLQAQVTLNTTGITNEINSAKVDITVGGGKQVDTTTTWLLEMTIDTTTIDPNKCGLTAKSGGGAINVQSPGVKAGTYKVYIKVLLND